MESSEICKEGHVVSLQDDGATIFGPGTGGKMPDTTVQSFVGIGSEHGSDQFNGRRRKHQARSGNLPL
ncbi:MAG TPA: hypothetical protein VHT30_12370 [Acidimicrobiales bacterium]|nr:hypothetical protein [Acidimicrobiales bacterium]